jgi:dTDP-4-dehydrorhamnose 3,5-epimerase
MIITEASLKGAYIIDLKPIEDERGFFARTFCKKEFTDAGLNHDFVQCNSSRSVLPFTLRGMHYQTNGSEEVKLIRCVRGRIQDVIIDLRRDSDTYCKYVSIELSENNNKMLYVPVGFAHGFLSLEPYSEIAYMVSNYYSSKDERGVRWNDSAFQIKWDAVPQVISEKDKKHPDYIKQR